MKGYNVTILLILVMVVTVVICEYTYTFDSDKLVTTCEQNLPRDQNCVLVAVIEKVRGDL